MGGFKDLNDDANLLACIVSQFQKVFNDANKLRKQAASLSGDSSLFTCNQKFKDYLCTYIHPYDDVIEALQFDELKDLVNPATYKNGVFVMSKNHNKMRLDSDCSSHSNSIGPLNSTELEEQGSPNCSNEIYLNDFGIPIKDINIVYCGNCELFAKDVNAGGATRFHGTLGQAKKTYISLNSLISVSCVQARYLSSVYIQLLKHVNISEAPAFVICCQPKRPMNLINSVLFPMHTEDGKNQIHIVNIFEDKNKKRSKKTKEENIGQSSFLATYDLFKTACDEKTDGETSLRIEFHWIGNDFDPLKPPPRSAKTVIQLQVTVGEQRSAANDVYNELKRLSAISQDQVNLSKCTSYSEQLVEDLKKFKVRVSDIQFYDHRTHTEGGSVSDKTDDIETPMSQILMESFWHKGVDFTDILWTFIQQEDHIESIQFILDDILTDIVSGSLQPAISPSNETKLAKYIRKLYVDAGSDAKTDAEEKIMELLSSEQAIMNLVREIGFEKLRKDYFHFFLSRELTSVSYLEKICKVSHVNIRSLWKLHYCLEVVITPTIYLNLTPDCQCSLLKAAIDYYSVNDVDIMSPIFCLSLVQFYESKSIQALCEDRQPIIWQEGLIHPNKCGFDEALISRIENRLIIEDDETEAFILKEVKRLLQEETLVLPNKMICNGN